MYWRFIQLWWYKELFQSKTWDEFKCALRGYHKIVAGSGGTIYQVEPDYYCDACGKDCN